MEQLSTFLKTLTYLLLAVICFGFPNEALGADLTIASEHEFTEPEPKIDIGPNIGILQQDIVVTGTITDSDGNPLPGANILEKGTKNGTQSDFNGKFSIEVADKDAVLEISFLGFKSQEVVLDGRTSISIELEASADSLEEVILIGYGSTKKKDLTGSVVRANIEDFSESPNTSIAQSLQGTVAGLNVGPTNSPGQDPGFSIRGQNNLGGSSNRPLVVLDGAIYNGLVADLNTNDIASVDVLRDASASAIYGSRAANGVIIITTKRGTSDGKPIFSFTSKSSVLNALNPLTPQGRDGYLQKVRNVYWRDAYLAPDYIEPNPDFKVENFLLSQNQVDGVENGTDQNWVDLGLGAGYINEQNLSMRNKTEDFSYFISANFVTGKGLVINDDYQRFTVRVNLENKVSDWLTIGLNSFFAPADYSGISPNLGTLYGLTPLVTPYDENGELKLFPDDGLVRNPLYYKNLSNRDKRLNLYGNGYAELKIPWVKGLSYRFSYTGNYRLINDYNYDPSQFTFGGAASKSHRIVYDYEINNRIEYKKTFNEVHQVDLSVGSGRNHTKVDQTRATSGDFAIQGLLYNRLEDGDIEKQLVSSALQDDDNIFYFARGSYRYDNKYLLTATIRRDGDQRFGKNNKFATFPSIAGGWVFSEENFLDLDWLNFGKLRVSYGKNGANTIPRYSTLAGISSAFNYVFEDESAFGTRPSGLANPNLKWETTTGLNFGLDFKILNSRLNGTLEYYNTNTENILVTIPIPNITGFGSIRTNLGKVHNWGVNVTLNSVNIKTPDFSWNTDLVFSLNRNEIVSVLGRDDDGDGVEDDLVASNYFIGKPLGAIYDYTYLGIYQLDDDDIPDYARPGQYRWKDLSGPDGVPDGDVTPQYDREIIGYTNPSYRFSIRNEFNYKNFSFSFFLNSIQGGKDRYYGGNSALSGQRGENTIRYNWVKEGQGTYWTPSNPDADFRAPLFRDARSETRYFQRSFVRLQNVSLSYNLPQKFLGKIGVNNIKLYVSGKNLHTWTDWRGLDPETGAGLSSTGSYPLLKSYTLGLNLTF